MDYLLCSSLDRKSAFFLFLFAYYPYFSANSTFNRHSVRRETRVHILNNIIEYLEGE